MRLLVLQNPFGPPSIPERMVWTSSAVKLFRKCKRKFFWKYVFRLRPKYSDRNLAIGSAFHNLLGEWYHGKRSRMPQIVGKYTRGLLDAIAESGAWYDQEDLDNFRTAVDTFEGMMRGYERMYDNDRRRWNIQRGSIEAQFRVPFRDFDYAGKIDLVVGNYLVEHKTASKISESYIDRLPLDTQIRGYIYGTTHGLGLNIDSVLYDVVRKCKLRRKSNESMVEFAERVAQDYVDRPDFYFYREQLRFDKQDLEAFVYELHQTHCEYTSIVREARDVCNPRFWCPDDQACFDFFRTCEYHKLCTTGLDKGTALTYHQGETLHQELEDET